MSVTCHVAAAPVTYFLALSLGSTNVLWDVTSFHTERFFFISLGSWDTWRLCFEIHILTSNYTALPPWWNSLCQITLPARLCSDPLHCHRDDCLPLSTSLLLAAPREKWLSVGGGQKGRVSGLPWLRSRARQLEGGDRGYPRRVIMWRKLVSVDTCSTACVPSVYFKSLLSNPSGDAAESPEPALPVIQVLDVTGQMNSCHHGHSVGGRLQWFNQEESKLSLWKHNSLTWRFSIRTSGIYKPPEIISKTAYICEYARSGERIHSFHQILLRFYSLMMLKLHIQRSDSKEKFFNSLTKKQKER